MIRTARAEEAGLLGRLAARSKAYWGYSSEFLERCREELALAPARIAAGDVFVLEEGARVLGFFSLEHVSGDTVELAHLFVDPERIGAGHGRALLDHACKLARGRGYRTLVIQGDPNAEPFYAATGAQKIGSRESSSIPGRQLPLLEVRLTPEGVA